MSNRRVRIRISDVTHTVRGVLAAGLPVARVEVEGEKVVIYTNQGAAPQIDVDDLDRELMKFKASHGED